MGSRGKQPLQLIVATDVVVRRTILLAALGTLVACAALARSPVRGLRAGGV